MAARDSRPVPLLFVAAPLLTGVSVIWRWVSQRHALFPGWVDAAVLVGCLLLIIAVVRQRARARRQVKR